MNLSRLDWSIFVLLLLITFAFVLYGNQRKEKNQSSEESYLDLILMGRKLTLPLFVATLVATWYGGIFGVTKMAYQKGLYNFLTQGIFWYITYLLFALFLVKKIRSTNALTLPDLVLKEFGPKSQKIAAILNLFNVIPITYAISIGLFINLLTGLSLFMGTSIGVIFVLLYSTSGGLRAVVYSDLIQFFIMLIGVFLVIYYSISEFGGLYYLQKKLPTDHLSLTNSGDILTTTMWGIIALSTLVDPNFYQRCLAAKDSKTAQRGIFISTVIWIFFDLCTTFGALYAFAYNPNLPAETAYLNYALQILPDGVKGLMLAGIFATIVSTLDSYIFLGATTIVNDLFPKFTTKKIRFHHFSAIAIGIAAILFSVLFQGNILKVWKLLGGMSSACLLIPIVMGRIFKNKIKDHEFYQSSLNGIIAIIIWNIVLIIKDLPNVDDLYIGSIGTGSTFLYYLVIKNRSQA